MIGTAREAAPAPPHRPRSGVRRPMIRPLMFIATLILSLAPLVSHARDEDPKPPKPPEPTPIIVEITLKGVIEEDPVPVGLEGAPVGDNLKGIVDKIKKAKADPAVKGL